MQTNKTTTAVITSTYPRSAHSLIAENMMLRKRVNELLAFERENKSLREQRDAAVLWQRCARAADSALAGIADRLVAEVWGRIGVCRNGKGGKHPDDE